VEFFNIRDIENLTGIKAHTLRTWEKRYGMVTPINTLGKQRIYDNKNLKHILRISTLYHGGFMISKIAEMSMDEIAVKTLNLEQKTNFEVFINRFIEFTIDMDEMAFKQLFSELRESIDEKELFLHIIFPLLQRIGNLWMIGNILLIQEHFAFNLIRTELICSIDRIQRNNKKVNQKIILFCPENEYHELPLLFINLLLKKNKLDVIYLGPNVALETLKVGIEKTAPTLLFSYMITNFIEVDINHYINNLSEVAKDCKVFCAGPGFKSVEKIPSGTTVLQTVDELIKFTEQLN
jgi:DNA-binding transcriptional MerR regulator